MRCWVITSWLVLTSLVGFDLRALDVPFLAQRVTDLAELLDPASEQRLEGLLQAIEGETGAQVAVLTVPSLDGEVLEDYAIRVVETWQLGRDGVDDGVLVLVARDDRKVRIEVGYGLEGTITDLTSRQIIDGAIVPAFRRGDFVGGIEAAVDAIGGAIRGEPDAVPVVSTSSDRSVATGDLLIWLFVLVPFGWSALMAPGRRGWMLWLVMAPFFLVVSAGVFGARIGFVALGLWIVGGGILRLLWPDAWRPDPARHRGHRRGGWSGPWIGGGGGGFSGGGGFGGFSGGGGSFGGGGASGGW
ncbi:MAG: TPM domain-containing protein [Acidobacteriota bacterium]